MSAERAKKESNFETISIVTASRDYLISRARGSDNPLSGNSLRDYRGDLGKLVQFCEGRNLRGVGELGDDTIFAYFKELRDKLAPRSVARNLSVVSCFLEYCRKRAPDTPSKFITGRALRKEVKVQIPPQVREILTKEEAQLLLVAPFSASKKRQVRQARDAVLILIALKTGANSTEIVELKLDDVRVSEGGAQIRLGKKKKERIAVIARPYSILLEQYLKHPEINQGDCLFPSYSNGNHGEHITRQGFWLIVNQYSKNELGKKVTPRTLRNTYIYNFDGSIRQLGSQLGIFKMKGYRAPVSS